MGSVMELLMVAASSLCAGVPMFAFLGIIWWLDRYDREPVWLLAVTFLWGAVGAIVLGLVGTLLGTVAVGLTLGAVDTALPVAGWVHALSGPALVAPLAEEPAKALILLAVIWNADFDNMTDGFVYGAAAGLGFAMTENFMYFVGTIDDVGVWIGTVVVRTGYSGVMHAMATATVGAALGWARFRGLPVLLASGAVGMALGMGIHALWNGLLTLDEHIGSTGLAVGIDFLLLPMEVAMIFAVFQICLWEESSHIRSELEEEVGHGLMPAPHPAILASWTRRLGHSWLTPGVNRDRYIETATTLAMRKRQVRQMGDRTPPFYRDEVERLRHEIDAILACAV